MPRGEEGRGKGTCASYRTSILPAGTSTSSSSSSLCFHLHTRNTTTKQGRGGTHAVMPPVKSQISQGRKEKVGSSIFFFWCWVSQNTRVHRCVQRKVQCSKVLKAIFHVTKRLVNTHLPVPKSETPVGTVGCCSYLYRCTAVDTIDGKEMCSIGIMMICGAR